jgi:hypothetical protein
VNVTKTTDNLADHASAPRPGSDRAFGLVFAGVFGVVGIWLWYHHVIKWWPFILAFVFLAAAALTPRVLRPLNWLWFRLGMLLHAIISPIIIGLIFVVIVMPTAIFLRLLGKDVLDIRRQSKRSTYWIAREQARIEPDSMRQQF